MALKYLQTDDVTGQPKLGPLVVPVIEDYVLAFPQTDFVTANNFSAGSFIEVFRNGQSMLEGAGNDWTRSVGTTTITFNYSIPVDSWVRIQVNS